MLKITPKLFGGLYLIDFLDDRRSCLINWAHFTPLDVIRNNAALSLFSHAIGSYRILNHSCGQWTSRVGDAPNRDWYLINAIWQRALEAAASVGRVNWIVLAWGVTHCGQIIFERNTVEMNRVFEQKIVSLWEFDLIFDFLKWILLNFSEVSFCCHGHGIIGLWFCDLLDFLA